MPRGCASRRPDSRPAPPSPNLEYAEGHHRECTDQSSEKARGNRSRNIELNAEIVLCGGRERVDHVGRGDHATVDVSDLNRKRGLKFLPGADRPLVRRVASRGVPCRIDSVSHRDLGDAQVVFLDYEVNEEGRDPGRVVEFSLIT